MIGLASSGALRSLLADLRRRLRRSPLDRSKKSTVPNILEEGRATSTTLAISLQ